MVDRATANSSPRTAAGHKQDDQIVKTKPLTQELLADSGSEPGVNASPLFKEPAARAARHNRPGSLKGGLDIPDHSRQMQLTSQSNTRSGR